MENSSRDGFPDGSGGKESAYNAGVHAWKRLRLNPWARKIPWRREWQPTPVFLGNSMDEEPGGLQSWGCKESYMTEQLTFTCLLRNLYAGQEATVRTGHVTTDRFQVGKGERQGCILSPCLYAEYIIWNARLDEAQAGIKIARKNINKLRYAEEDTPLWQKVKRN